MRFQDDYTTAELMACVLARSFPDGAWGATGANSQIATAAMQLSRHLYAPNLTLMVGGSGVHNPTSPLVWSSGDGRWKHGSEFVFDVEDIVSWELGGYRKKEMIACLGGMQVDRYGNINMIGIGKEYPQMAVRGPGTVGLYFATRFHRIFLFVAHHDLRIFPEEVDFVSGPGRTDARSRYCIPDSIGPVSCVTPLCTFGFSNENTMEIRSLHPGVTFQDVQERTGWELAQETTFPETAPPSEVELRYLREVVDPYGVLREIRVASL